jgi:hypothetical protein
MAYANVTKSNFLYQARENIKTLIQANLTNPSIQIYSKFPNIKSASIKGFPFIVLTDSASDDIYEHLGTPVYEHNNMIEGYVYHDSDKMGDNQLRTIKQNIAECIMNKSNQTLLAEYNMHDVNVMFNDTGGTDYFVMHQKQLYESGFTINYNMELNFA